MTTVTIIERKHSGRGIVFTLDGDPQQYYAAVCCDHATIQITDIMDQTCISVCEYHGKCIRQYDPVMTHTQRESFDQQFYGSGLNPVSDPCGDRNQRRRRSGYTTSRWYQARGL